MLWLRLLLYQVPRGARGGGGAVHIERKPNERPTSIEALKAKLCNLLDSVNNGMIQQAYNSFLHRCRRCIENDGCHYIPPHQTIQHQCSGKERKGKFGHHTNKQHQP